MNLPDKYRLDRGVLETAKLTGERNDRQYWLCKAFEILRQIALGDDPATERASASF
jgi:hypothetical protein